MTAAWMVENSWSALAVSSTQCTVGLVQDDVVGAWQLAMAKLWLPPKVVPAELLARTRYWYVAPQARLESTADAGLSTAAASIEAGKAATLAPYAVLVPYSKATEVLAPPALTSALSVAPVVVMAVAGEVETEGANGCGGGIVQGAVVKTRSAPVAVATLLTARTRK